MQKNVITIKDILTTQLHYFISVETLTITN